MSERKALESIERAEQALEKQRAELEWIREISAALPASIPEPDKVDRIAAYASGRVVFGSNRRSSREADSGIDRETFLSLIVAFPPVDMVRHRGNAFQPASYRAEQHNDSTERICPIRLDVTPTHHFSGACAFSWFTELAGMVVRVEAVCSAEAAPLEVFCEWRRHKRTGERLQLESCTLRNRDPLFWRDRVTRWATGDYSEKTPNQFTVWWTDIVDDEPTAAQIAEYVEYAIWPQHRDD